jgi:membrane-associated protease RseP (regulator of RpoE activity)
MTVKHKVSLLVSLVLACALIAYAQQTPPQAPSAPTPPPAETFSDLQSFAFFTDGGSFLGVYAEDIDKEKIARYGLREAKGVGVTKVVSGSPAEKAGLRKDDVIVRFDNENVTSVRKLNRLVTEVAPDQTVRLGISRGGSEQEVSVTLAKRNNYAGAVEGLMKGPRAGVWTVPGGDNDGFVFALGRHRRIGVSTMGLTRQLADYFGIVDGKGVLVTSVSEDSPAAKAGIKAGDVITAVDGEKVEGAGDLSRALNKKKEGDVTLTFVRERNQRSITVTPKESGPVGHSGAIAIPDIDVDMPNVNIRMPRIVIPDIKVMPDINVTVPRVRVSGVGSSRPI